MADEKDEVKDTLRDEKLRAKADEIALTNEVKAAEQRLLAARAAREAAIVPALTEFAGIAGGLFAAYGTHLENVKSADVKIDGHTVQRPLIRAHTIKGTLPIDVKPGQSTLSVGVTNITGVVVE